MRISTTQNDRKAISDTKNDRNPLTDHHSSNAKAKELPVVNKLIDAYSSDKTKKLEQQAPDEEKKEEEEKR